MKGGHIMLAKILKKGICILTSFCILLHFTSIIIYGNDEITTFTQNEKIQDIDILLDRAIDQKNDAPTYVVKEIKNNCKLIINGEEQLC